LGSIGLLCPSTGHAITERSMPLAATIDLGHHHFATDIVYFYMNNGIDSASVNGYLEALEFVPVTPVPGPVAGACLPGLIFAGGLLGRWQRKRNAAA
jgi:hypothetical protein